MAGIEKICEFSGNYPGWLMYDYKHNNLQIEPQWRKYFKNTKEPVLYLCKSKSYIQKNPERKCYKYMDGCIVKKSAFDWSFFLHTPNLPNELQKSNIDLINEDGENFKMEKTTWFEWIHNSDIRPLLHNMRKLTGNPKLKIKKLSKENFDNLFEKLS
jgi:hypothetical protein